MTTPTLATIREALLNGTIAFDPFLGVRVHTTTTERYWLASGGQARRFGHSNPKDFEQILTKQIQEDGAWRTVAAVEIHSGQPRLPPPTGRAWAVVPADAAEEGVVEEGDGVFAPLPIREIAEALAAYFPDGVVVVEVPGNPRARPLQLHRCYLPTFPTPA